MPQIPQVVQTSIFDRTGYSIENNTLDFETRRLFDMLHFTIMLSADSWAKIKSESMDDVHRGELIGSVRSWYAAANHFELPNTEEIYSEYRALWEAQSE